jgi:hypothetical protein
MSFSWVFCPNEWKPSGLISLINLKVMEVAETKKWERENGDVAISFFGEERDGNEKRNEKNIKEK